jgi:hypothetical protein
MSESCNEWNQKSTGRANVATTEVVDGELKITCTTCENVDSRGTHVHEGDENVLCGKINASTRVSVGDVTNKICIHDGDEMEKMLSSLRALEEDVHTLEREVNMGIKYDAFA